MIQSIGEIAAASRVMGLNSKAEGAIKCLVAMELGLPLTSAFKNIYVVNGRPAIEAKIAWALVLRSGLLDTQAHKETRLTDDKGNFTGWEVSSRRTNGLSATRRFTVDDAKRAGLLTKDNWKYYPEDMCWAKAMSRLCGALWPDVINGLSFIEELDTPNTIEGQWTLEKTVTLDDLVAQHGAEAVMEAAGGELPQTPAQVRVVADKLNAQPA
jgi:hypothetical protein